MEEIKIVSHPKSDKVYWLLIFVLVVLGIVANSYFKDVSWAIRFAFGIVVASALFGLAAITTQGKRTWTFIKNAQIELRKVVWPTREETVKITLVVAALVFAMSLILWVVDSFLLWLVGWFTK